MRYKKPIVCDKCGRKYHNIEGNVTQINCSCGAVAITPTMTVKEFKK